MKTSKGWIILLSIIVVISQVSLWWVIAERNQLQIELDRSSHTHEIDDDDTQYQEDVVLVQRENTERDLYGMWVEVSEENDFIPSTGFQFQFTDLYGPYTAVRLLWETNPDEDSVYIGFYEINEEGQLILWYREQTIGRDSEEREFVNVKQVWQISWFNDLLVLKNGDAEIWLGRLAEDESLP